MPGRRRSSTMIQKDAIEQANIALQQLPEKPKDNWSLREAIDALKDTILTALDRGYTYEEVAAFLSEQGVKISPSSLKSYLTAARRDAAVKPEKGRRGRRPKSATVASADVDASADVAPKPRRGRKPKAVVEAELAAASSEVAVEAAVEEPTAAATRKRSPRSTTTRRGVAKATTLVSQASTKPRGRGRRKGTEV